MRDEVKEQFPVIEWEPKSPAEQLAIFEAAFDRLWDFADKTHEQIAASPVRPGLMRHHVIDLVGRGRLVGVLLICSRDRLPFPGGEIREHLHISASLHHTSLSYEETQREVIDLVAPLVSVERLGPPVYTLITPGGIQHIFFNVPAWVRDREAPQ